MCEGEKNEENVIDLEEMRVEHNWRNKNPSRKKRLDMRIHILGLIPTFCTALPTIPNENRCSVVQNKEQSFIVRNTCGFDTVKS